MKGSIECESCRRPKGRSFLSCQATRLFRWNPKWEDCELTWVKLRLSEENVGEMKWVLG